MTTETLEALSIIATILGAIGALFGAVNLRIYFKKIKKNNVTRSNFKNSNVDIGDKIYNNGATVDQVEKSINERIKYEKEPYGVSLDRLKELAPTLEKDKRYFIPIVWVGTQAEYDEIRKNGKALNEVMYITPD